MKRPKRKVNVPGKHVRAAPVVEQSKLAHESDAPIDVDKIYHYEQLSQFTRLQLVAICTSRGIRTHDQLALASRPHFDIREDAEAMIDRIADQQNHIAAATQRNQPREVRAENIEDLISPSNAPSADPDARVFFESIFGAPSEAAVERARVSLFAARETSQSVQREPSPSFGVHPQRMRMTGRNDVVEPWEDEPAVGAEEFEEEEEEPDLDVDEPWMELATRQCTHYLEELSEMSREDISFLLVRLLGREAVRARQTTGQLRTRLRVHLRALWGASFNPDFEEDEEPE